VKIIRFVFFTVIVSWIATDLQAQNIVELARQSRERRKAAPSKGVLTVTGTPSAPAATDPAKAAEAAAQTAKGPTDNKGRDEKFWRDAVAKARQDVKRSQDKLTVLELRATDLHAQLLREGIYTREMDLRAAIAVTEKDVSGAKADVASSEQRLRDLEEELRRSNGLPGWAR